ncbi:MAG: RluA family pseudouridine synthase [Xanthobacteraceae bacterium]
MAGGDLFSITVGGDEGSARLDRVLALHCGEVSRSRLKALILAGHAKVGAATVRDPAYHVAAGETITIALPPATPKQPAAEAIPLAVVYEDDDILVIDKPAGLVVHPAAGHARGTLVNALIAHCGDRLSDVGDSSRPGIVHRLDKDTTGLMVVAKTGRAHAALTRQFADHGRTGPLRRGYLAFVWGVPNRPRGTIEAPIDRHPHARERMAVREGGREAITHWETIETFAGSDGQPIVALLACTLDTGRTHQIRVHLAHIGHPLLGDTVYAPGFKTKATRLGPKARAALGALGRQALHARLLTLAHPGTGEVMSWQAPLPQDLSHLQSALRAAQ